MSRPYRLQSLTQEITVMQSHEVRAILQECTESLADRYYLLGKYSALPAWMSKRLAADTMGCGVRKVSTMITKGILRTNDDGRVLKEDVIKEVYRHMHKGAKTVPLKIRTTKV